MRTIVLSVVLLFFAVAPSATAAEVTAENETLLLQQPTVSDTHIVFVYANDLWVVDRAGGVARRLTSDIGSESRPRISPDGQWVAYSAQYDGNTDVYLLPIEGGRPKRLTYHPGGDTVWDWHPDGKRILVSSWRNSSGGGGHFYLVSTDGGMPEALAIPRAHRGSYRGDGSSIAYAPYSEAFWTWKRYRGGRLAKIWIYDPQTHDVEEIPQLGVNNAFPTYLGEYVYFASDEGGRMDLYRYRPGSGKREKLTSLEDYDIRSITAGAGVLAIEQGGAIHIYDPANGELERIRVRVISDDLASRPRWQKVDGFVRGASIAPNGKRAVFEARGEIISVPREHGDARNITDSPGEHDRDPIWSPDGEKIAWLSDRGGEYRLWIRDRRGREPARSIDLGGAGFYYAPTWSPKGDHIAFRDKANQLAYVDVESGEVTRFAENRGSLGVIYSDFAWSPDGRWIAFEQRNERTLYDRIALYSLDTGETTVVTDGFAETSDPAFSRDQKHLFFTGTVEAGPEQFGLDMETSTTRRSSRDIYVAVLQADGDHPFGPRSDEAASDKGDDAKDPEEKKDSPEDDSDGGDGKEEDDGEDGKDGAAGDGEASNEAEDDKESKKEKKSDLPGIDLDGLDQRVVSLPIGSGYYSSLACSTKGLHFLESETGRGGRDLMTFDMKEREKKKTLDNVGGYSVSADGKSAIIVSRGSFQIVEIGKSKKYSLGIDNFMVRVDPAVEWPQILREAWRIERDYFYDPAMHGVDWAAMWPRWSRFLPHVRHRDDLDLLISEMIGELACGHNYVRGGETPDSNDGVPVGLLGADVEVSEGRYRISRIYRGQNWNPRMRAPLTEPGVDANEGDYVVAVNGRPLTSDDNFYAAFEYSAGKQVELTLSANADGSDARTTTVVPLSSEWQLRRMSWVEDNRRRVDELSGGRLAYIYMPNTGGAGLAAFDRDFYSQLDKEGLILDERFNGGGKVADYVIHVLKRKVLSYWMNREMWPGRSPFGMIPGPKVMVVNERAGSGGDWMPWAFQREGIGPVVGTRTWGGLVGISGYPSFMDGGSVTAASFGVMDPDGNWAVENVGCTPDHEVVQWPQEVIAGRDPQLEKAIELALEALENTEPEKLPEYTPPTKR